MQALPLSHTLRRFGYFFKVDGMPHAASLPGHLETGLGGEEPRASRLPPIVVCGVCVWCAVV